MEENGTQETKPPTLKQVEVQINLSKNYQSVKLSETYTVPSGLTNVEYEQYLDGIAHKLTNEAKQKLKNVLQAKEELDNELEAEKSSNNKLKKPAFGGKK